MKGPLSGLKVLEFAGLGPVPFACGILADMGASIIHVGRADRPIDRSDPLLRDRLAVQLNLKDGADRQSCLELASECDILVEGFRPGVMERLALGPDDIFAVNDRLVYGRMTGWGQTGPLSGRAGHDVNYLALTGVLHAIGASERPSIPLNLIGDFGGGAMYLVAGVLAGVIQARLTGKGTVVDTAMVDGIGSLASAISYKQSRGAWNLGRESNYLDGASSRYRVYECKDGKFIVLGAIEPQFYDTLRVRLHLDDPVFELALDPKDWATQREAFARLFLTRPRDDWVALCDGADCCLSPVLDFEEARQHALAAERGAFRPYGDGVIGASAPRFASASESPGAEEPHCTTASDALARLRAITA